MILTLTEAWCEPLYFDYGVAIQNRSEEPVYAHWAAGAGGNTVWRMAAGAVVPLADLGAPNGPEDGVLMRKGETFVVGFVTGQRLQLRAGGPGRFAQVYLGQWQFGGGIGR